MMITDNGDSVFTGVRARKLGKLPLTTRSTCFHEGVKCKDLSGGRRKCVS